MSKMMWDTPKLAQNYGDATSYKKQTENTRESTKSYKM